MLVRTLERTVFYGVLLVVCLSAVPYGTVESWSIAIFECSIFLLGLLWVTQASMTGVWVNGTLRFFYPLMALICLAILQSVSWSQTDVSGIKVTTPISADAFESWAFAIRLGALTLAGILVMRFTSSTFRLNFLVHTIVFVAVLSSLFGIVREAMQHEHGFILPDLRYGGGYAQFINKNHLSFLIEAAVGLLLGITLLRRDQRERLPLYVSAIILLWVGLVMSRSRGGLLALTVETIFAAALFIYFKKHRRRKMEQSSGLTRSVLLFAGTTVLLIVMIAFGVVWLGGDQLTTGVETASQELSQKDDSHQGSSRVEIWRTTWRMARAHPFAGVGLGGYWAAVPIYHDASGVQTPQQAHSEYLELLASAGVIGVAIFVWFVFELSRRVRSALSTLHGFQRAAALGALIGIVGIGVHSLVDFGLHITVNGAVFMMLLAILALEPLDQRPATQAHRNAAFN